MRRTQHHGIAKTSRRKSPLPESSALGQTSRSCIICHRRKVRCDRKEPCSNCVRHGSTCQYPETSAQEAPRKPPSLQDVTDRLERVEALLLEVLNKERVSIQKSVPTKGLDEVPQTSANPPPVRRPWETLVTDGKRIQYVDNTNLLDLFQDEDRINPPEIQPSQRVASKRGRTLNLTVGLPSVVTDNNGDWHQFYPDTQLALILWTTYIENVDPVLKILHIPTMQSAMINVISRSQPHSYSMSALAFAVYFASVTSLSEDQLPHLTTEDREEMLQKYKKGINQVVTEGQLFNEPDLTVLQALAIFATSLRVHDNSRTVWILIGTTIRLAQSIGIHREGASLRLSPFESEIRLRLWWHLCLLDSRAPEDHGFARIESFNHDLRLPLNIDDNQLFPAMQKLPQDAEGWTETSFGIMQLEVARLLHQVLGERTRNVDILQELAEKRKIIDSHSASIEKRFFPKGICSTLQKAASSHYYAASSKMVFMLQVREDLHVNNHRACPRAVHQGLSEKPFRSACDTLRKGWSLVSGEISPKFVWVFKAYTQWYALAYVLRYLCAFPSRPGTKEARVLVNKTFGTISNGLHDYNSSKSNIWRCLLWLQRQASEAEMNAGGTSADHQNHTTDNDSMEGVADVSVSHDRSESLLPSHVPIPRHDNKSFPASDALDMPRMLNHLIGMYQDAEVEWQDGDFAFGNSIAPEMLYLPEWSDIVNRGFG
ncbi:unnamed protein product [Clonostachys byssicola]|uniref:Zn(2)-C6 fungal-type domain-containing protein n=1 Tax=Clonostachys byssicola TaxID=160290 RepID=A0A9N9Y6L2_9HYPO|nr:unnamed protein product [Clonostachys byssicola]